ncbi:MAG: hypothetical protein AB8G11_00565 [Saprospiraceae bacterium]
MKINKIIIAFLCIILTISCNWQKVESVEPENSETATPEVLLEEEKPSRSIDISYIKGSRYDKDIVSQLYEEVLEKDAALKALNDKIVGMSSMQNDSLRAFNNYASQNSDYWEDTKNYINQIQDEALKASTAKAFEDLQKAFNNKIAVHESAKATIAKKSIALQDRFLVMKLMITQAMMNNYQKNELPDIQPMNDLIKEYDKLIQEAEQMSQ